MIKIIIFDFDGVIVESVDIKTLAFGKLFENKGNKIKREVISYHLANTGVSRFEKIKYIYRKILREKLDKQTFKKLCERFSRLVVDDVVAAPYVKGAEEFLRSNKKKYIFYVISATPQGEIEEIIRRRGLTSFFKNVYGAPYKKAEVIKRIIKKEVVAPDETVFVGDALGDRAAAKASSVKFVARINKPEGLFDGIDCAKIYDFRRLTKTLTELDEQACKADVRKSTAGRIFHDNKIINIKTKGDISCPKSA